MLKAIKASWDSTTVPQTRKRKKRALEALKSEKNTLKKLI
jgi:hypothetical protein